MKIAIWWNIPCKSIVPVARELANFENNEIKFISQSDLSESRKSLGWELPNFGNAEYKVLPEINYESEIEKILNSNYDIHIFNGVYLFPKIRYALDLARKKNIPFGVISEAYHNPYTGFKRVLKTIFTRCITPFRVFPRIQNAKFILSASGNSFKPFSHLGWKKEQFFPFGYFPENEGLSLKKKEQNKTLQLLCTGYITKNKGQELLIRALKSIKNSEIKFHCTITGFGPEEETIKKLINDLNLVNEVTLTGVVGDSELNTIKSKTDLLIAPGYEEPWGIRINEAILAHTPVLVSDGIGACELIYKSKAGKVFKSGDINSLIEELEYLLNENNLLIAKENVKQYADRISPKAAAIYLYDVICFTLNKVKSKPTPVWLQDN